MNYSAFTLKDPSSDKVKIRRAKQSHEYVVPTHFATIPTNHIQSRIMKSAHTRSHLRIPSIKEQDEYETEDDDDHLPKTPIDDDDEEEDENIPLAMLAFRKGFVIPNKVEQVYPLIQHVPQMVPVKCSNINSSKTPFHISNHQYPMMYNYYSAMLPPMHYPENRPQQQPQHFYHFSSSNSSLSSTSELASNKCYRRHDDYQVYNRARQASSACLYQ
ncbi:hypothetical protein MBANPS3_008106 [Mucor bainieri]